MAAQAAMGKRLWEGNRLSRRGGFHNIVVKTFTYTNLTGGNLSFSQSPAREFSRLCEPPGGDAKDIYTIFAQNTQYLPVDLSTVYGMSQKERILELVKYVRRNDFDVVALSEVFSPEARDFLSLHMRQGYPYQFGSIDTAGDVAFTLREGSPYEATSGLAIYSQFPPFKQTKNWNSNYQCTDDLFNQISALGDAERKACIEILNVFANLRKTDSSPFRFR